MGTKDIRISETDEKIVVDMYPGMFTTAYFEQEPTKKNPDIKVDIGKINGKLTPIRVYYPKAQFSKEDIIARSDKLMEKKKSCPMCERKKREIMQQFKSIMEKDEPAEKKKERLFKKLADMRKEQGIPSPQEPKPKPEPIRVKKEEPKPVAPTPVAQPQLPPPVPTMQPMMSGGEIIPTIPGLTKSDKVIAKEKEVEQNLKMAINQTNQAIHDFFTFPHRLLFGKAEN